MKLVLAPEATEFGEVLSRAVAAGGGVDLARRSHLDPSTRITVDQLLARLGVWDIDPRASEAELEAAAVACRVAGRWALPYPVAERLCRGRAGEYGALALVGGKSPRVNMADLDLAWAVSDGDGRIAQVIGTDAPIGTTLGRHVCPVEVGPWTPGGDADLLITLQAWALLGHIDAAATATYRYVSERQQFGQPLGDFQAVRFRLTDVEVAVQGLAELAKYTLWSVGTRRRGVRADATALRLTALEAAESTFRTAHQLHGAIGFCDETDLSWLSRSSQPLRRLPWGHSETAGRLLSLVETDGFEGLFDFGCEDSVPFPVLEETSIGPLERQRR